MNIMGIGPQEMMVIAVIALLIFGPGKLPEVMGQAGKLYRDFRKVSAELSGEFEKTIAEARDATAGLTAELGSMSKEVSSVTSSVKKDLGIKNSTAKGKTTGTKTSTTKTGTASKSTTTSKSTTSTPKAGTKGTTSTTTSSASKAKTAPATTATTAKKVLPVASREDPDADVSLFEPTPVQRQARKRRAVPSVIADPTPRTVDVPAQDHAGHDDAAPVSMSPANDAVSRARQRRRTAGYARNTA